MTLSIQAKVTENTGKTTHGLTAVTATPASAFEDGGVVATSTSEGSEVIDANITGGNGPGLLYLENLDATDAIDIGFTTTVYDITLDATGSVTGGSNAVIPLKSTKTTIFHKAAANTPKLRFKVYER